MSCVVGYRRGYDDYTTLEYQPSNLFTLQRVGQYFVWFVHGEAFTEPELSEDGSNRRLQKKLFDLHYVG